MIRVLIESASAVARAGLHSLLENGAGLDLVDTAELADVIIRDDTVRELNGFAGRHAIPVVLLSDETFTRRSLDHGIRAILPPHAESAQIIAAIHAAASGLLALIPSTASTLLPNNISSEEPLEVLTTREHEVLELLAEGLSNKQIAARLSVSDHTARFHVNSILSKLDAGTRTEAVTRGIRTGILKV